VIVEIIGVHKEEPIMVNILPNAMRIFALSPADREILDQPFHEGQAKRRSELEGVLVAINPGH